MSTSLRNDAPGAFDTACLMIDGLPPAISLAIKSPKAWPPFSWSSKKFLWYSSSNCLCCMSSLLRWLEENYWLLLMSPKMSSWLPISWFCWLTVSSPSSSICWLLLIWAASASSLYYSAAPRKFWDKNMCSPFVSWEVCKSKLAGNLADTGSVKG